jgi:flagellar biosynthetic protein FlhB
MTQLAGHDDASARTYDATANRLAEARREGRVARSVDLTAAAVVLVSLVLIGYLGTHLLAAMREMTACLLDGREQPLASPGELAGLTATSMRGLFLPLAGVLAGAVMAALAVGALQVGAVRSTEPIKPRWSRLSPLAGIERLGSCRMWVRAGFIVTKILLAAGVLILTLQGYWQQLLRVGMGNADAITDALGGAVLRAGLLLGLGLVVLGVLDWLYQRWQYREDLKMTHRQWREELRRSEGDPQIRRRQRRQVEQQRQRLGTSVPHANAVVTAPDGPAVALQYTPEMPVPRVVATGQGREAEQIRSLAEASGIYIATDADLAGQLASAGRAGQAVPRRWQKHVREVIARSQGVNA